MKSYKLTNINIGCKWWLWTTAKTCSEKVQEKETIWWRSRQKGVFNWRTLSLAKPVYTSKELMDITILKPYIQNSNLQEKKHFLCIIQKYRKIFKFKAYSNSLLNFNSKLIWIEITIKMFKLIKLFKLFDHPTSLNVNAGNFV